MSQLTQTDPRLLVTTALVAAVVLWAICYTRRATVKQRKRRSQLHNEGLSPRQRILIEKALPWYRRIPPDLRRDLEGCARVFLDEIPLEPCGALQEVTEEMQLVIATLACLLVVRRPKGMDEFQRLNVVLVHPTSFSTPMEESLGDVSLVDEDERVGESWEEGTVVIAWDAVLSGSLNHSDGLNVVAHEFSHQLDQIDGSSDGAPILDRSDDYQSWTSVLSASYDHLRESIETGAESVLDEYGTENPAEFFAVATEAFFEHPHALAHETPDLFSELKKFYRLDPRKWRPS